MVFKSINDKFGHIVGDDAIFTVGQIMRSVAGHKGILCRYGGDEFVILLYIKSQNEITDMIDSISTQTTLFNKIGKRNSKDTIFNRLQYIRQQE